LPTEADTWRETTMGNFCPFVNANCVGERCTFWRAGTVGGECLLLGVAWVIDRIADSLVAAYDDGGPIGIGAVPVRVVATGPEVLICPDCEKEEPAERGATEAPYDEDRKWYCPECWEKHAAAAAGKDTRADTP